MPLKDSSIHCSYRYSCVVLMPVQRSNSRHNISLKYRIIVNAFVCWVDVNVTKEVTYNYHGRRGIRRETTTGYTHPFEKRTVFHVLQVLQDESTFVRCE